MKWQNLWIVAVLLFFYGWYFVNQQQVMQQARRSSASIESLGATGQQIFYHYRLDRYPDATGLWKRAILSEEALPSDANLIIAGPLRPVSKMEADTILKLAAKGGQVYVSFHDEQQRKNLLPLLHQISSPSVQNNVQYHHGLLEKRRYQDNLPISFMEHGEEYAFYSSLVFQDDLCLKDRLHCFIRDIPWDKGRVFVQLGLPLSSNALLTQSDNTNFIARWSLSRSQLIFDEYHHFHEEAEISDLLTDLSFMAPLIGLVLICLLAMLVQDRRRFWPKAASPPAVSKQWHELMIGVLEKKLHHPDFQKQSLELQLKVLKRLYPEAEKDWQAIAKKMTGSSSWKSMKVLMDRTHHHHANQRRAQADVESGL